MKVRVLMKRVEKTMLIAEGIGLFDEGIESMKIQTRRRASLYRGGVCSELWLGYPRSIPYLTVTLA